MDTEGKSTFSAYSDSFQHINDELRLLNLRLLQEFLIRKKQETRNLEETKGFFISSEEIHALLNASLDCSRKSDKDSEMESLCSLISETEGEISQRIAKTDKDSTQLPLLLLRNWFSLSPEEMYIILIALAVEMDRNVETVYAYFNDDLTKRSPTVDLALRLLFHGKSEHRKGWSLFSSRSNLQRFKLINLSGDHRQNGFLNQTFRLDERIKHFLVDGNELDEAISAIARIRYPQESESGSCCREEAKRKMSCILDAQPASTNFQVTFWLYGKSEANKRDTIEALADELRTPLLLVDLWDIFHRKDAAETLQRLFREAILQSAILSFRGGDLLFSDEIRGTSFQNSFFETIRRMRVVFVSAETLWMPEKEMEGIGWFPIECSQPGYSERMAAWKGMLGGQGISETDLETLAARYSFNERQIRQAVRYVEQTSPERSVTFDALCRSSNLILSKALNRYSKRIETNFSWQDIVLPAEKLEHLKEITAYIRNKHRVFHSWGFIDKLALGRGVNIIFSGASGTGKTMSADIMATELRMELYKVNLSSMVSKYIGETEKNLNKVFDEMSSGNTILFFDEADALFGKRSEVKDAHDRYANIETNYLLQKIEEHEGVVILATNLKKNIDEAFSRRMHFSIEFPFPERAERERIWRQVFPAKAPLSDEIDYPFLAERLKVTGGNIKNIALTSAFHAIENGGIINMQHIINAAKREYQKIGKSFVASDFEKCLTPN